MSPKVAPAPIPAADMSHQGSTGAEQDPFELNPIFIQNSSVRLTAFGSVAQTALAQEEGRRSAFSQDGTIRALHSGSVPPRLSHLQSMGSASSDRPLIETPGYVAMESYPSAEIERPPSPSQSNDSRLAQPLSCQGHFQGSNATHHSHDAYTAQKKGCSLRPKHGW